MAYDEKLDVRVVELTADWNLTRKKMFGGICYLLNGNMLCGVYKEYVILRLGDQLAVDKAMEKPHVKPFDITGRAMSGWVMVAEEGCKGQLLKQWLLKARTFVDTLPVK